MSVVIRAVGSALPARAVPNDDLPAALETSDEWIKSRTGIAQRYIAAEDETTSSLAIAAARSALDSAGLTAADIDGIIVATTTPDLTFRCHHGARTGFRGHLAFDLQAVCAGFIYAVGVADGLLQTGRMRRAIVIGSETMTRILNWEDRTTCVLFGDGAGAVIMERDDSLDALTGANPRGLIDLQMNADGNLIDILHTTGGPSSTRASATSTWRAKKSSATPLKRCPARCSSCSTPTGSRLMT